MLLAWDNKWDSATLAASSQIGTLPVTNTQQPHLSRKWNTAAAVKSAYVTADLGSSLSCSMLAVLGTNLTKNATARLRLSASDAAGVGDCLYDSGTVNAAPMNAFYMPGTAQLGAVNYASTPDSPANSLTGDQDIRFKVMRGGLNPNLTSAVGNYIGGSYDGTVAGRPIFSVSSDGWMFLEWVDGGGTYRSQGSAAQAPLVIGQPLWLRVTLQLNDGAGNRVIKFYYSYDYDHLTGQGTWNQVGATLTIAGVTTLPDATMPLFVGSYNTGGGGSFFGHIYCVEWRDGIGGQLRVRFDPGDAAVGALSWTSSATRELWTITQQGGSNLKAAIVQPDHMNLKTGYPALYRQASSAYLSLPGRAGNYAAGPGIQQPGDLDVRVKVMFPNWSLTGTFCIAANWGGGGNASWEFYRNADHLQFSSSADGFAVTINAASTVAAGIANGTAKWVRVVHDVDNGAGGNDVKFYLSDNYNPYTREGTWTQLGATVTTAGVHARHMSAVETALGAVTLGTVDLGIAKFYYMELLYLIEGPTIIAFDPSRASASGVTQVTGAAQDLWTVNQSGTPKAELLIDKPVNVRYARVDLNDYSVASNLQVGRVFLGPSWQPTASAGQGMLWGWSVTPKDPSRIAKSRGGQVFADVLPQTRVLDFTLSYLSEAQINDNAFALARAQGRVKDALAIPFESGSYVAQQAVWGLVQASEPVVNESVRIFRQKFQIEERL